MQLTEVSIHWANMLLKNKPVLHQYHDDNVDWDNRVPNGYRVIIRTKMYLNAFNTVMNNNINLRFIKWIGRLIVIKFFFGFNASWYVFNFWDTKCHRELVFLTKERMKKNSQVDKCWA